MFELLFTGLYLGAIHLFSSPDHLAAIIPLTLADRKRSWRVGLIWGLGHLIGITLIGVLLYYFKSVISFHFLEHYGMLYIALLLVAIGLWIVYKSKSAKDVNGMTKHHNHLSQITLGTGVLHGVFAISHIYSLAPTISMNNLQFFSYFGGFAIGSVLSVSSFTYFLGIIPNSLIASPNFFKKILLWSGIITIGVGLVFVTLFFIGITPHAHH